MCRAVLLEPPQPLRHVGVSPHSSDKLGHAITPGARAARALHSEHVELAVDVTEVQIIAPDQDLARNRLRALSLLQREALAVDNAAVDFDWRVETGSPLFVGHAKGLRHSVEYLAAVREGLEPQA